MQHRQPYNSDVSDREWTIIRQYLPQRGRSDVDELVRRVGRGEDRGGGREQRPVTSQDDDELTALRDAFPDLPEDHPFNEFFKNLPKEFRGPIEEGVKAALQRGYVAGFPCINVHVKLIDGSYHDVDSSQEAFIAAGSLAIREAYPKLKMQLLEPWMLVEVETPDQFTGGVMGSLQSKRAIITETLDRGANKIIRCEVPLGEMFGYTTDLRSMSQGRAGYSMEPSEYKPVPASMVEKLAKKA